MELTEVFKGSLRFVNSWMIGEGMVGRLNAYLSERTSPLQRPMLETVVYRIGISISPPKVEFLRVRIAELSSRILGFHQEIHRASGWPSSMHDTSRYYD